MRQRELANCTFAKTILMLLVVLYHSILFWAGGNWFVGAPVFEAKPLLYLAKWLNSFHIYGFTFISGYLFYYLRFEKGAYQAFVPFIRTKAKRLLIPYAFTAIVWVIPIGRYFLHYSRTDIFKKFVLGTSPNQLWFLLMLFHVFLIFWPLSVFLSNHTVIGAFVAAGLYGLGLVGNYFIPNIFNIWTACTYSPIFWIGFKMRQYGTKLIQQIPTLIWPLLDLSLFAVCEFLSQKEGWIFKILTLGCNFILHVIGSVMAFVVLQRIANCFDWNNKLFNFLSKNSLAIYLFHQQVIYFLIDRLNGVVNPYMNAAINFAGSLIVPLLLAAVLRKFKITGFCIGEKQPG